MAPINKESIQLLIELQSKDVVIDKLKAKHAAVPAEIAALRRTVEEEKAKSAAMKAEAQKLAVERKNKEVELASKEEAIRKHQNELNNVKSNEAFKALQHEIDGAKAAKGALEEEVLSLMDRVDQAGRDEKAEAKRVQEHAAAVEVQVKQIEAEAAKLQAEIDAKSKEREAQSASAPADLIRQYDSLRARKKGTALAQLKDGVCGGCNMRLPAQVVVNVKKSTSFVACDGCQRILYSLEAPVEQAASAAPAAPANPASGA